MTHRQIKVKSAQEILKELAATAPSAKTWERIGLGRRAGINVPLFSVYSQKSVGIGELDDLKLLIDWCVKTGASVLQLLPLNQCGPTFCAYDSVSSFALDFSYVSLRLVEAAQQKTFQQRIEELKKRFPCGIGHTDYHIKQEKYNLLWDMYLKEDPADIAEFIAYRENNRYWLDHFALFTVLKGFHQFKPWYEWQPEYRDAHEDALEAFYKAHEKEIIFQMWVQWLLYTQLKDVKAYAAEKNVLIKGDLPILVSRDSADVWAHPEYFKLEFAAGAPPDMYCAKGQRWGMPTYNWEHIFNDDGQYLAEKLVYAENFYDILRIDHVVGLFRIWSIPYNEPMENQGLHGLFDPFEEQKWEEHGKRLLKFMLDNTRMLLCAEDLGTIPVCCTRTLQEFAIPGNDVQRWIKDWDVRHDFLLPQEYRVLSVAMLSTHDTTNWAAWWENEAGTIDEALFARKCGERGIHYPTARDQLFDTQRSRYGRLRWKESIDSAEKLTCILGKRPEEVKDFIDIYLNSYREKEKLWKVLKLAGPMREACDAGIVKAMMQFSLDCRAVFSIQLITDWLYLAEIFKGDAYQYRFNTPGTTTPYNWSLTMPLSLEELLKHKVTKEIRAMVAASGRA